MHNNLYFFRLHLKQVRLKPSTVQWPDLRHFKHSFFKLTFCLGFTRCFTFPKSFSLFTMPSYKTPILICDILLTYFEILVPDFVTRFFLNHYINAGFWKVPLLPFPSSLTKSDQIWGNLYSMCLPYPSLVLSFPIASSNCQCVSSSLQNLQMRVGLPIPTTAKAMIAWTCAIRDYSPYHILFGADRQFIY